MIVLVLIIRRQIYIQSAYSVSLKNNIHHFDIPMLVFLDQSSIKIMCYLYCSNWKEIVILSPIVLYVYLSAQCSHNHMITVFLVVWIWMKFKVYFIDLSIYTWLYCAPNNSNIPMLLLTIPDFIKLGSFKASLRFILGERWIHHPCILVLLLIIFISTCG